MIKYLRASFVDMYLGTVFIYIIQDYMLVHTIYLTSLLPNKFRIILFYLYSVLIWDFFLPTCIIHDWILNY